MTWHPTTELPPEKKDILLQHKDGWYLASNCWFDDEYSCYAVSGYENTYALDNFTRWCLIEG